VVVSVKPNRRGRFRVSMPRASPGPVLYRTQMRLRAKAGGTIRTRSLVLRAD
jgi:hypothetical protein